MNMATIVGEYESDELVERGIELGAAKDNIIGAEVRWARADGYAEYMIASESPLELLHCVSGDAWTVEDALIRGLILEDVQLMVANEQARLSRFKQA